MLTTGAAHGLQLITLCVGGSLHLWQWALPNAQCCTRIDATGTLPPERIPESVVTSYTNREAERTCPAPSPFRVVAFEPVRKFRAYLEWALHANGVAWLVDVVPHVGDEAAATLGHPAGGPGCGPAGGPHERLWVLFLCSQAALSSRNTQAQLHDGCRTVTTRVRRSTAVAAHRAANLAKLSRLRTWRSCRVPEHGRYHSHTHTLPSSCYALEVWSPSDI